MNNGKLTGEGIDFLLWLGILVFGLSWLLGNIAGLLGVGL